MEIYIDCREPKTLFAVLDREEILYKSIQMPYGDICFVDSVTNTAILVIERKTYSDLASSITGSRYRKQLQNLKSQLTKAIPYYLIEGTNSRLNSMAKKRVNQALINIQIRDKIGIFVSKNINDTVNIIKRIEKCLTKYGYDIGFNYSYSQIAYGGTSKTKTPSEYLIDSLCLIPGIGEKTADVISKRYDNVANMIDVLKDSSKCAELSLINISSRRKIGMMVVNKIKKFYGI